MRMSQWSGLALMALMFVGCGGGDGGGPGAMVTATRTQSPTPTASPSSTPTTTLSPTATVTATPTGVATRAGTNTFTPTTTPTEVTPTVTSGELFPILPDLVGSDPADGATGVVRTAWIHLSFAAPVPEGFEGSLRLWCDAATEQLTASALAGNAVIVNPEGDLPAAAHCSLTWPAAQGLQSLSFETAPAGEPATVLYDRSDTRRTAPFPDDLWLVPDANTHTGVRLAVPAPDGPTDLRGLYETVLEDTNQLDGFSPVAHLVIELSDAPDPVSLPHTQAESLDPMAAIGIFNLNPDSADFGQRIPFVLQVRDDVGPAGLTSHTLLLFPSESFLPGERYGLVVTRRAFANPGRPFDASGFFQAALAPSTDGELPALTRVRALASEVLGVVGQHALPPIPAEDVALALRFTTRSFDDLPNDLRSIKEQVLSAPPPAITVTDVYPSYGNGIAAIIRGTWEAPDWRTGAYLARNENGQPMQTHTNSVPFILALPDAALAGPVPVILYQHGNPGSAENEVPFFASLGLAEAGFAVVGFTDNLDREVSDSDIMAQVTAVFLGLLQTHHVPDYWAETNAEQIAFIRAIRSLDTLDVLPLDVPDGIPDLNVTAPLGYFGISNGSFHGPGLLPYAPEIRAAALTVGGAPLVETLIHQQADTFVSQVGAFFVSATPADIWVAVSMFQTIFDRQDGHNQAWFMYRQPFPVAGTLDKASVLLTEGLNDSMVPNNGTEALAWLLGPVPLLNPVQRAVTFLPIATAPLSANIDSRTTAALFQYVPAGVPGIDPTADCESQFEGHFCPQTAEPAIRQRVEFFRSALDDPAPRIIDPLAGLTP